MSLIQSDPAYVSGEYTFGTDKSYLDLQYVYNILCVPSAYTSGLPPERFPLVIKNSICFHVLYKGKQMGFARVITDYTEFASLWDVFIDEEHRGQGLAKILMNYILQHRKLRGIFRWFLMTEDVHKLYEKFGFKTETWNPYIMMRVASSQVKS